MTTAEPQTPTQPQTQTAQPLPLAPPPPKPEKSTLDKLNEALRNRELATQRARQLGDLADARRLQEREDAWHRERDEILRNTAARREHLDAIAAEQARDRQSLDEKLKAEMAPDIARD